MTKRVTLLLTILLLCTSIAPVSAQRKDKGYTYQEIEIQPNGDTILVVHILPVDVRGKTISLRRYRKLVDAVKKVYPIAQTAKAKLADMKVDLSRLSPQEQRKYIRRLAAEIEAEYTPVLREMTYTQGKVLLKLIDRETSFTAYEILREFRGTFLAGFWQGVSRIFRQNLKTPYDPDGEDRIIEQIVIYYEAGLLK